ncbi:hypothetical protein BC936DRAFT_148796 [Jimgerdemannia flammicorona]|uniref:Uncharacterized protein n=1 Tax=Jimgerdemannia flammicorona TaxID=994334 RepID=A0A433D292_9FUNG|nr:hypothetical protein BC936DRAFT_148796 [Jimgerdemannia flammicorona]
MQVRDVRFANSNMFGEFEQTDKAAEVEEASASCPCLLGQICRATCIIFQILFQLTTDAPRLWLIRSLYVDDEKDAGLCSRGVPHIQLHAITVCFGHSCRTTTLFFPPFPSLIRMTNSRTPATNVESPPALIRLGRHLQHRIHPQRPPLRQHSSLPRIP